jgi:hypothetical protein
LEDNDRFFGRDQEIAELIERLRLHPFITVIGPSGSGKSSLVLAGLIPTLKKSRLLGTGEWQIRSMRPGETPETTLRKTLGEGSQVESARVLLLIDQFEELFTLAKEEALPFQESLLKLAKTTNVYLILTVRADFYADLMTSLLWPEIQNYRLEVVPLNETGLRQAILKPAENVGVFVEPALVERLVVDAAGEPGILPLIQETLVLLWQRLERRFLPLRAYEALVLPRAAYGGQEPGHKTGLLVAIARRADQAIRELTDAPEKQQAIARRIFLRLVQFGEGRADTRRQQSVEALRAVTDDPKLFDKTLTHLVSYRLLTPSGDDQNLMRTIDIAHEVLIVGWPTLQQWIMERRAKEEVRRRLSIKIEEWTRFNRGMGGLLDPVALAEAESWLSGPDAIDLGYDEGLPALITASRTAIEAAEYQKQEQAQRELQLIQERLAEEKKARKADKEKTRAMIGALSGILIATGVAFFFSWQQQQKTLEAKRVIQDQSLGIEVPTPELARILPQFLAEANELSQQPQQMDRAMAYYRKIRREADKIRKDKKVHLDQRIPESAQKSLNRLIEQNSLPILESQLSASPPLIGHQINGTNYGDREKQFTPGALQTTYRILMHDTGADTTESGTKTGVIESQEQVNQIPCKVLQEIEDIWHRQTNQQCSFYGDKGIDSERTKCKILNQGTIGNRILPIEGVFLLDSRIKACIMSDQYKKSVTN